MRHYLRNFFVNYFLTDSEQRLNLLEVIQDDDFDNICQDQDHRQMVPFFAVLPFIFILYRIMIRLSTLRIFFASLLEILFERTIMGLGSKQKF